MARGNNRGAGGNAGNAGNRQPRRPRIKVGYTDLARQADGTFSAKLTAEVGGGRGDEQVQFFVGLDPKGTEISVDEFGHAQTLAAGLSGANHTVKAVLVDGRGVPIAGTEVSRTMEMPKVQRQLPDKIHARPAGRGRVFVSVAVLDQGNAPIKGAAINIFEAGESRDPNVIKRRTPLKTMTTDERGALDPVPYFDVPLVQGKRRLLVHVAGTKLEAFVTCRASTIRPPEVSASLSRVAATYKKKLPFTRTIRAFLRGVRMGSESLRKQREEGSK